MKKIYEEPKISILDMDRELDILTASGPIVDDKGDAIWDFDDIWGGGL